jgi:hypothetical protein
VHDSEVANIRIYADGSGLKGEAGAAAALYRGNRPPKVLRYHLGSLTCHTTTDSEAVGGVIRLHLLQQETNVTLVSMSIDNRSVITATNMRRPRGGQHIIQGIMELADEIIEKMGPGLTMELR